MEKSKKEAGRRGEEAAASRYESDGYRLVERNWRYGKIGEVDIIAEKGETVVFAEVKYRKDRYFAAPAAAVNIKKQNKIRVLAELYLSRTTELRDRFIRFDVAEVYPRGGRQGLCVNIIENAF